MSRTVIHNGTIYFCGQVAQDSSADITKQTESVLDKIDAALLIDAGSDKYHLLSVTIYIKSMDDFRAMNEVWDTWALEGHAPCPSLCGSQNGPS